jgi:hypothetical protein
VAEFGLPELSKWRELHMSEFMSVSVGQEATSKVLAVVRSHPEGVTVPKMMADHGFTNRDTILAAIEVLKEEGKIRMDGSGLLFALYK